MNVNAGVIEVAISLSHLKEIWSGPVAFFSLGSVWIVSSFFGDETQVLSHFLLLTKDCSFLKLPFVAYCMLATSVLVVC